MAVVDVLVAVVVVVNAEGEHDDVDNDQHRGDDRNVFVSQGSAPFEHRSRSGSERDRVRRRSAETGRRTDRPTDRPTGERANPVVRPSYEDVVFRLKQLVTISL